MGDDRRIKEWQGWVKNERPTTADRSYGIHKTIFVGTFKYVPQNCIEKYKYLLTETNSCDILTERLLGELRPVVRKNAMKREIAGICPVTFVEYVRCR